MSLSELRLLFKNKKYESVINKSQTYLYSQYPNSILSEVFRLCKLSLKKIKLKKKNNLYFSHNLNREGAPLALFSLIENMNKSRLVLTAPKNIVQIESSNSDGIFQGSDPLAM